MNSRISLLVVFSLVSSVVCAGQEELREHLRQEEKKADEECVALDKEMVDKYYSPVGPFISALDKSKLDDEYEELIEKMQKLAARSVSLELLGLCMDGEGKSADECMCDIEQRLSKRQDSQKPYIQRELERIKKEDLTYKSSKKGWFW